MVTSHSRRCMPRVLPSLLLAVFLTAQAQPQTTSTGARPDPLDPKVGVPALRYESSLAQYRRMGDERAISWRDANDTVARIGGWRVYAREASQPEAAPAVRPAAPASGPIAPAEGHGHHGKP